MYFCPPIVLIMKKIVYLLALPALFLAACNDGDKPAASTGIVPGGGPATIPASIIKNYPHNSQYFTEGLEFYEGKLYESSGGDNEASPYPSEMGEVNMETGTVDTKITLDKSKYFGEGITFYDGKLYMLTYISKVGFVFDAKTFQKIREFPLPSREGWGLTHDSTHLIMSDGSNNLYYLNPQTLQLASMLSVSDNNGPVANINELEYIDGFIYANQWQTPYILKINPATGKVVGRMNFDSLVNQVNGKFPDAREMNGIAYDPATGKTYITGKLWPEMYEIKF